MTGKKSFILYTDMLPLIEKLPDEKAGQLFKIILEYVNDRNPKVNDLVLEVAFEPIKQQLKRDLMNWNEIREKRSKAGQKSAEVKKQKTTKPTHVKSVQHSSTKSTVNDNVNVNVSVNENVILKYIESLPQVLKLKMQPTAEECEKLVENYGEIAVKEVLDAMDNHAQLTKKYTSVYKTCNNWCRMRKESKPMLTRALEQKTSSKIVIGNAE